MDKIIEVNNLRKNYDNFKLQDISFSLEKGCIMGFIGENGAGKTTTIKLLLNVIDKLQGEIKIFGKDHIQNEIEIKEKIGYVPADDYFTASATLANHVKAMKPFYQNWDDDFFGKIVDIWRLPLKQKISEFSKGMKTKAMLALALAHRPHLLILDEPTAGLDPVARIEVLDILREFVSDGEKSVFFSTHITSDLDKVADYITLIHNGRIIECMRLDQIEEKYALVDSGINDMPINESEFIGIRKGSLRFEGLILREKAIKYFDKERIKTPNIENLLTFTIWGDNHAKSHSIIESL